MCVILASVKKGNLSKDCSFKIKFSYLKPHFEQIKAIVKIAAPAILQFVIASCSWIFLAELVATTGGDHGRHTPYPGCAPRGPQGFLDPFGRDFSMHKYSGR